MSILVVGDANADLSAALARFPIEGDDCPVTALGWGSGGSAANVAAALALLGTPVRLLVRVGVDPASEVALGVARGAGVDLALVQHDAVAATGLCFAAVSPSGERTFFSFRGANIQLELPAHDPLDGARWLHLSAYALLEGRQRVTSLALIEAARRRNIPISLDLCLPLLRERCGEALELLPHLRVLFANRPECAALLPDQPAESSLELLVERGAALVALKLGADGCVIAADGRRWSRPAFAVAALDSNGCGDAFVAGFIHAYINGASPQDCAMLGNALGALAVTQRGAADALPDRARVRGFLAEHAVAGVVAQLLAAE